MANRIKKLTVTSVDLCKQGANPDSFIRLAKSTGEPVSKTIAKAAVMETADAVRESLLSIVEDGVLAPEEKAEKMAESLQAYTLDVTDCIPAWALAKEDALAREEEAGEVEEEDEADIEDEPEPTKQEKEKRMDMEKMSPEDRAAYEALQKKYELPCDAPEKQAPGLSPEVQKALDEMAELRKQLELRDLTDLAKRYEIAGKNPQELARKLYELKKSGEQAYVEYLALLDEQVELAKAGVFKDIGSDQSGAGTLDAVVSEMLKQDSGLTREQAVIKAFETNPGLDPFTGKLR